MLHIVCWKWQNPGYRSTFTAEHVNTLNRMIGRHYRNPYQLTCLTDDPTGIDPEIRTLPIPTKYADLPSPWSQGGPSCYRRLWLFSEEARDVIGERIVSIDLDCVITGDMTPVWDRPEDFVGWNDPNRNKTYCGSMWLIRAGTRTQVWETFDPETSPATVKASRTCYGSDQGWMSIVLGPDEAKWGKEEGVYSWQRHLKPKGGALPPDARVTFFHGAGDPWTEGQKFPWVREHYR